MQYNFSRKSRKINTYNAIVNAIFMTEKALEFAGEGIIITDPNQKDNPIVYCNHAFQALTGYSSDKVLNKNCRFLQGTKTDRNTSLLIKKSIEDQKIFSGIILNYRKDGTSFWNHLTISPIFDDTNHLINFVGIQRDVTHMVEAQKNFECTKKENDALKKAMETLLERVNKQELILRRYRSKISH